MYFIFHFKYDFVWNQDMLDFSHSNVWKKPYDFFLKNVPGLVQYIGVVEN
jgi:hypothetical protein